MFFIIFTRLLNNRITFVNAAFYIEMIISSCQFPPKDLFSTQKGYLDEELDYRKQSLDQAHKVRTVHYVFEITHSQ